MHVQATPGWIERSFSKRLDFEVDISDRRLVDLRDGYFGFRARKSGLEHCSCAFGFGKRLKILRIQFGVETLDLGIQREQRLKVRFRSEAHCRGHVRPSSDTGCN